MSNKSQQQKRQRNLERKRKKRQDKRKLLRDSTPSLGRIWNDSANSPLDEARELLDCGDCSEATAILREYCDQHPRSTEALELLIDASYDLEDYSTYCHACEQLIQWRPNERPLRLMLAGGYLADERIVTSLREFQAFVERWPDDPQAQGVNEEIAKLGPAVDELLEPLPFAEGERLELAVMHESMLANVGSDWPAIIRTGEKLLKRSPKFVSAMNNMTQAYIHSSQVEKGIAMGRRALEIDADNVHALSNLAKAYLLANRRDEASEFAQRLLHTTSDAIDRHAKQAEAFAYLGDDDAVVTVLRQAEKAGNVKIGSQDIGLLYHLGATSLARQGDVAAAKRYWKKSLKVLPGLRMAEENLADLRLPASERNGAWAYGMEYWIPKEEIEPLVSAFGQMEDGDDARVERVAKSIAKRQPELVALIPELLDRGDPAGCTFATLFAKILDTPAMRTALKDFALGTHGSDELRMSAIYHLKEKEAIEPGMVRMRIDGKWRELELKGYEIYDEPRGELHSEEVEDLAADAIEATHNGDGAMAESLLLQAIDLEPDKPDLLNNLATAYEIQGKADESERLNREIHERWPDYFFGQIQMAKLALDSGDIEKAEELLAPLRAKRSLHQTEFSSLCMVHILLFEAQKNFDAAESWLDMWKQAQPDHPQQAAFESRGFLGRLRRLARK